jgi:hypothetical protein
MPDGNGNGQEPEEKDPRKQITFGFDQEGFLNIKIHRDLGLWNLMGALKEAEFRVWSYFLQIEVAEAKKGLLRPDKRMESWYNKWRH